MPAICLYKVKNEVGETYIGRNDYKLPNKGRGLNTVSDGSLASKGLPLVL